MARILLVDDSPADLKFLEAALKPGHHYITSVSDPSKVEEVALRERPELIMVDIVMPERSGYEVVRSLRRLPELADMKVIFVSSKGNESDVKWGMRQGAADYVVKPYTPEQVLGIVARHVS